MFAPPVGFPRPQETADQREELRFSEGLGCERKIECGSGVYRDGSMKRSNRIWWLFLAAGVVCAMSVVWRISAMAAGDETPVGDTRPGTVRIRLDGTQGAVGQGKMPTPTQETEKLYRSPWKVYLIDSSGKRLAGQPPTGVGPVTVPAGTYRILVTLLDRADMEVVRPRAITVEGGGSTEVTVVFVADTNPTAVIDADPHFFYGWSHVGWRSPQLPRILLEATPTDASFAQFKTPFVIDSGVPAVVLPSTKYHLTVKCDGRSIFSWDQFIRPGTVTVAPPDVPAWHAALDHEFAVTSRTCCNTWQRAEGRSSEKGSTFCRGNRPGVPWRPSPPACVPMPRETMG